MRFLLPSCGEIDCYAFGNIGYWIIHVKYFVREISYVSWELKSAFMHHLVLRIYLFYIHDHCDHAQICNWLHSGLKITRLPFSWSVIIRYLDMFQWNTLIKYIWKYFILISQGDSGSPAVTTDNGTDVVHGVVSFGWNFECGSGYPDGFARVSNYVDWINGVIAENS